MQVVKSRRLVQNEISNFKSQAIKLRIPKIKFRIPISSEVQIRQSRCTFRNPKSIDVNISKSKINRGDHFEIQNQFRYTFQNPISIQVYVSKSKIKTNHKFQLTTAYQIFVSPVTFSLSRYS
jgi:hypothetical protein